MTFFFHFLALAFASNGVIDQVAYTDAYMRAHFEVQDGRSSSGEALLLCSQSCAIEDPLPKKLKYPGTRGNIGGCQVFAIAFFFLVYAKELGCFSVSQL